MGFLDIFKSRKPLGVYEYNRVDLSDDLTESEVRAILLQSPITAARLNSNQLTAGLVQDYAEILKKVAVVKEAMLQNNNCLKLERPVYIKGILFTHQYSANYYGCNFGFYNHKRKVFCKEEEIARLIIPRYCTEETQEKVYEQFGSIVKRDERFAKV